MIARMERRRIARVTLSGTQTVWTHEGVAARLLDLSLAGGRLAHAGILRPGARCLVYLPTELGSFRLPAQILWCTILGAAVGPDGERVLQAQSGLGFSTLTEAQRTGLAGLLQQARTGEPPGRDRTPQTADPSRDLPPLLWRGAATRLPGKPAREARAPHAELVGRRPARLRA